MQRAIRKIIRAITGDGDPDTATYRIVQSIGQAQSRMLRMTGVFRRAVNSLERQRVHMGQSGLSSSDIVAWLRNQSQERLIAAANDALFVYPQPMFVTPKEMLDTAEYELIEREREKTAHSILPPSSDAPETGCIETERLVVLEQFLANLNSIETEANLGNVVVGGDYPQAATGKPYQFRTRRTPLWGSRLCRMAAGFCAIVVAAKCRATSDAVPCVRPDRLRPRSGGDRNRTTNGQNLG